MQLHLLLHLLRYSFLSTYPIWNNIIGAAANIYLIYNYSIKYSHSYRLFQTNTLVSRGHSFR